MRFSKAHSLIGSATVFQAMGRPDWIGTALTNTTTKIINY